MGPAMVMVVMITTFHSSCIAASILQRLKLQAARQAKFEDALVGPMFLSGQADEANNPFPSHEQCVKGLEAPLFYHSPRFDDSSIS